MSYLHHFEIVRYFPRWQVELKWWRERSVQHLNTPDGAQSRSGGRAVLYRAERGGGSHPDGALGGGFHSRPGPGLVTLTTISITCPHSLLQAPVQSTSKTIHVWTSPSKLLHWNDSPPITEGWKSLFTGSAECLLPVEIIIDSYILGKLQIISQI